MKRKRKVCSSPSQNEENIRKNDSLLYMEAFNSLSNSIVWEFSVFQRQSKSSRSKEMTTVALLKWYQDIWRHVSTMDVEKEKRKKKKTTRDLVLNLFPLQSTCWMSLAYFIWLSIDLNWFHLSIGGESSRSNVRWGHTMDRCLVLF